ncbi:hypothetical protein [Mesomycoplasma neurolyticum]|uniref:Lipoprotein n=1 Tax=Mesomycoplasma neurolyticum TaxID=2120 RepID=A0A449A516_9BACT|nr:hypothetical protein [Mesomycoplasma neurolyticum]VEU59327.1 Uncharacterised protein [Mesomycoplasma neurolyticum]
MKKKYKKTILLTSLLLFSSLSFVSCGLTIGKHRIFGEPREAESEPAKPTPQKPPSIGKVFKPGNSTIIPGVNIIGRGDIKVPNNEEDFYSNYGKFNKVFKYEEVPKYDVENRTNLGESVEWIFSVPELHYEWYSSKRKQPTTEEEMRQFTKDYAHELLNNYWYKQDKQLLKGAGEFYQQNRELASKEVVQTLTPKDATQYEKEKLSYEKWKNNLNRLFNIEQMEKFAEKYDDLNDEEGMKELDKMGPDGVILTMGQLLLGIYSDVLFDGYVSTIDGTKSRMAHLWWELASSITNPDKTFSEQANIATILYNNIEFAIELLDPRNYPSSSVEDETIIEAFTGKTNVETLPTPFWLEYEYPNSFVAKNYKMFADHFNFLLWLYNLIKDKNPELKQKIERLKFDPEIQKILDDKFFKYEEIIQGHSVLKLNIKLDWDITKEQAAKKLEKFFNEEVDFAEKYNSESIAGKVSKKNIWGLHYKSII